MAEQKLTVAEKLAKLETTILEIDKAQGKGTVMLMGQEPDPVPMLSTGNIGIDYILGGGFAQGRIAEVLGMESGGKTSMCLHTIAETQKNGGVVAFIDAEHALDLQYAKNLGVKTEELLLSQPNSGEQALEVAASIIDSTVIDLVVVDSVAALIPQSELDGDVGDAQMGKQARLMSQACRMLTGRTNRTDSTLIFTNQWRSKIGVMFGPNETPTGGNALKFYATQRIDARKCETTKTGEDVTGMVSRVKCIKNKVAPPFKQIEIPTKFGEGFNKYAPLLDLGISYGLVEKSGTWYSVNGEKIGQGKENAMSALKASEDLYFHLNSSLRKILFPRMYKIENSIIEEKKPRRAAKKEEEIIQATEESE